MRSYLDDDGTTETTDDISEDSEDVIPFRYSITSYGADYPVDALVKRLNDENIFIPEFQREYIWTYSEACRFIESLLLGLPVPGIFLAREGDSEKLLVIDGNQRLKTLQYFYSGYFKNMSSKFSLKYVQPEFEGKTYVDLDASDRRKLDDSIIHVTIIRQDEPSGDDSSIYHIFERLNTGGRLLKPQEIRACIYHGKFNELLNDLNKNKKWREMYGQTNPHNRLADQELILRFFALYFGHNEYSSPMKDYLNIYMGSNRNFALNSGSELCDIFNKTVDLVYSGVGNKLGKETFRVSTQINAAFFDAMMVGIATRISRGDVKNVEGIEERRRSLLSDREFVTVCKSGTSDEKNVNIRIGKAIEIFEDLE